MKIVIIGAGISGLSVAQFLKDNFELLILEKGEETGGIARTRDVEGVAYHLVGGHCFNSKNPAVLDFVFNKILPQNEWHRVDRVAKISFKGNIIDYPIEYSIKQIAEFDERLALNITADFFSAEKKDPENLAQWFIQIFGKTLAEEYLIPYNEKIWGRDPYEMDYVWVKDKLPIPDKKEFFRGLIGDQEDSMPHSFFYYPNKNNQRAFLHALSKGLDVRTGYDVESIEKCGSEYVVNGEIYCDLVINTSPLNKLPNLVHGTPETVKEAAKQLKYNKVSNMLWKTEPVKNTWTYYPGKDTIFHRHIHIGNFFKEKQGTFTITEAVGERSYEDMLVAGTKIDYLIEPLDYNISDHAYVVYDQHHQTCTRLIKNYMTNEGVYTLGRFGEWEYYNMDVCIEKSMQLSDQIREKYR